MDRARLKSIELSRTTRVEQPVLLIPPPEAPRAYRASLSVTREPTNVTVTVGSQVEA
jgi:hypothetical protein